MKNYTNHHFLLVLRDVNENTPALEDVLFEAGCDDALISYKYGIVSLTFDRKAERNVNIHLSLIVLNALFQKNTLTRPLASSQIRMLLLTRGLSVLKVS